jgi:hypothetical protein
MRLGGVLPRLQNTLEINKASVAFKKIPVDFGRDLTRVKQTSPINWPDFAGVADPLEAVVVDLITGVSPLRTCSTIRNA